MFILDVLRHDDAEQLHSILRMMNNPGCIGWRDCWSRDFTDEEVLPALEELVRLGQVRALVEGPGDRLQPSQPGEANILKEPDALWFELTDEGRRVWGQWEPPVAKEDAATN